MGDQGAFTNFSYEYDYGDGVKETFTFETFAMEREEEDLKQLLALYVDTMRKSPGLDIIKGVKHMQTAYSKQTSLREGNCITWKVYYQGVFIGLVCLTLLEPKGLLQSHICLLSKYQNREYDTKAFVCLAQKILITHRTWLESKVTGFSMEASNEFRLKDIHFDSTYNVVEFFVDFIERSTGKKVLFAAYFRFRGQKQLIGWYNSETEAGLVTEFCLRRLARAFSRNIGSDFPKVKGTNVLPFTRKLEKEAVAFIVEFFKSNG